MKKTTKENKESSWLLSVGAETEDGDFGEKQAVAAAAVAAAAVAAAAAAAERPDSFHTTHGVTRKWQEQNKPAQSRTDLSLLNKVEKWNKSKNTKAKTQRQNQNLMIRPPK